MEESLVKEAVGQGLWAVLFVSLYIYQLKESRRQMDEAKIREDKLMGFINDMGTQFETLARQYDSMSDDIREIKQELRDGRRTNG